MAKVYFFILILVLVNPGFVQAETNHFLITQVQITGGTGSSNNDFIEIFNSADHPLDLYGHKLVKRTKTCGADILIAEWSTSTIIPARSFYLLAHSDFVTISAMPDLVFAESLANNNGIALVFDNQIIDSVAWGHAANALVEGSVFATNPGANKSLARKFLETNEAVDSQNNAQDFAIQDSSPRNLSTLPLVLLRPEPDPVSNSEPEEDPVPEPEPPQDNEPEPVLGGGSTVPAYSSAVIISEFVPNPEGGDSGEEWVELFSLEEADLSGWKLDDVGVDGVAGSSAFVIPVGTKILANQYLVINLPEGSFALNNSGGDTLRLLWPNNQVLQQIPYNGSAAENYSYARIQNDFAWTTIITKAGANQFFLPEVDDNDEEENIDTGLNPTSPYIGIIKINEFLPNPQGPDAGQEWVEIINLGTEPVYIHNWTLDDGSRDSAIGATAWKIQSPTIAPGGVEVLIIPAGKFTLNNSGADTLRLFDPNNVLVSFVDYSQAKEGLSFSLIDGQWSWLEPTPVAINTIPEQIVYSEEIIINEIFPEPSAGTEEFIELKNFSDAEVNLKGWVLSDNSNSYTLLDVIIPAGGLAVIKKSDSKLSLNNFGVETIALTNPAGDIVSQVEYEDPAKNQSYNLNGEAYAWSTTPTPGSENVIKSVGAVKGAKLPRSGKPSTNNNMFWIMVSFVMGWKVYSRQPRICEEPARIN